MDLVRSRYPGLLMADGSWFGWWTCVGFVVVVVVVVVDVVDGCVDWKPGVRLVDTNLAEN